MSATIGGMLALAAGIIVLVGIVPWVLRLVLGLKPMPAGPLRSRLLAASKRLNFRCRDFLLWNTRSGIANAMLLGMLPRLRYVVFTDRLLAEMSPDEVEAVFGHEVGHVKHRHLLFYLSFFVVSFLSLNQVGKVLDLGVAWLWQSTDLAAILDLKEHKDLAFVPAVSLLGAYVFIVFGFVSRRCERQADLFGCRAVSCDQVDCLDHEGPAVPLPAGRGLCPTGIRIFMAALEKVACLNGISRDRPGWLQSWQHGTIARRVEFLENVLLDPGLEPRFQRKVWLLKWEVFLGLFGLLLLLGQLSGWAGLSVRL